MELATNKNGRALHRDSLLSMGIMFFSLVINVEIIKTAGHRLPREIKYVSHESLNTGTSHRGANKDLSHALGPRLDITASYSSSQ